MSTSDPASLTEAQYTALSDQRYELLNWANITYRYHRKRQRFFDVVEKLTQAAAVVGGGVAVAGKTLADVVPMAGAVIAATSLLALVYGYADRRQSYKKLAEQAMQLIGDISAFPSSQLTEEQVGIWERARSTINLKEPPNLNTLVSKCEYEQAVAEGHPNHAPAVRWWRQAYMHFV